jgi:hypothetical protein
MSLQLQSLATTNPRWSRVVGYSPFSLCIIHKEGMCPSTGDINKLMMMMSQRIFIIIIIISLSQSTAGHRPLQLLAISLDLRLLASSS